MREQSFTEIHDVVQFVLEIDKLKRYSEGQACRRVALRKHGGA